MTSEYNRPTPQRSSVATRFLPLVERHLAFVVKASEESNSVFSSAGIADLYEEYLLQLRDSYTKRILFSARQAGLFNGIGMPPAEIQGKLRMPFEQFYLELDDDLEIERLREPDTYFALRSMLVAPELVVPEGHERHLVVRIVTFYRSWGTSYTMGGKSAAVLKVEPYSSWEIAGVPLSEEWALCVSCGLSWIHPDAARDDPTTGLEVPPDIGDGYVVQVTEDAPDGYMYYAAQGSALFLYLLAYLSAKSISIKEEPITRQQRRWLQAHGKTPQPWHIVTVEPRISNQPPPEGEPVGHHSFRYDVIGHLRFGRHKLGDGSYRHTVEWVPAHQRGLDHVEYIPKTYRVKAGREIHPAMRRYWGLDNQNATT